MTINKKKKERKKRNRETDLRDKAPERNRENENWVGLGGRRGRACWFSHYPLHQDDVQDLYKQLSMGTKQPNGC